MVAGDDALGFKIVDVSRGVGAVNVGCSGEVCQRWKLADKQTAVILGNAKLVRQRDQKGVDLVLCALVIGRQHLLQKNAVALGDETAEAFDVDRILLEKTKNLAV